MEKKLTLTQEWDKTFPKSGKVDHSKVPFHNRYGITLAADLYVPKGASGKLPAIAVCGPFGAVKEQAAGLYAQTMAERGFLTLAFDPSFTGESGGSPRPNGNTRGMVNAFQEGAVSAGHHVDVVDVCRLKINGCLVFQTF